MSSDGKRLLSALVSSKSTKTYAGMRLSVELFKGTEVAFYEFIRDHVDNYGVLPHPDTVSTTEGFFDAMVETIEPPEYYLKAVEKRYLHNQMKEVVIQAQELLKDENPTEAFNVVSDRIASISHKQTRKSLFDFRDSALVVKSEYQLMKADAGDYFVKFGWPTLDEMTGGIRPGDMVSFVGRPASGKTFQLLQCALYNWNTFGHTPLFISMEMTTSIIMQRLAAMYTHKSLSHLLKGTMSTTSYSGMLEQLIALKAKEKPLWMVDGNLASTVGDIVMACRQLKPSAVFVDGAYLVRHPNPKITKFDRLTENAELMKQQIASDLGIPVICSYQLNREVKKKKKGEVAGVDDIYGSDAIGQLSTVVLGLFEEESIETKVRRRINVLKGRNGESGSFNINWNFQKMDFSEILKQDAAELQFLGE